MRRWLLLPIFYLAIIAPTAYALNPAVGSGRTDSLASPWLLCGISAGVPSAVPSSSIVNPAAGAAVALPRLELNYAGLANLSTGSYDGTGIEAGGLLPGGYGVYGASARFLAAGSSLPFGTFGALNLSIAKALYPTLLVGAGLGMVAGRGDRFDWGLGLDLGFINIPGRLGPLRDFSWGAAIDNVGKPYRPFSGYASFPPGFTPEVGAGFSVYRKGDLTARLSANMSFPSFQDVAVGVGGSLAFGATALLRLFGSVDLHELLAGTQPFPLSGGIGVTFQPGKGNRAISKLTPVIAVEPVAPKLFAFGAGLSATVGRENTRPPVVRVDVPKLSYISPNGNGVKSNLPIPLSITGTGYIAGYELAIRNAAGQIVRTIKSPSLAISARGATGVLDRLFYVKSGVPVPHELVWNGTNENGQTVPDGTYTFTITAWDENGNRATSSPSTVIVDTKAPRLELTQPPGSPPIFSPNGNGYKDTLAITQSGSKERLWVGRFYNSAGVVVRTIDWKDSVPHSFLWDGRGNGGKVLPDGTYRYEISSTNLAGNTATATIPTIVIDTSRPAMELDVNRDAISPGTSSPLQTLTYRFVVPQKNMVSSWELAITGRSGVPVRTVKGGSAMPAGFTFDGSDAQGRPLPDGVYHAELSVVYRNGSRSSASAAAMTIDRVAPSATVAEEYHVFSPVGSGARTAMVFDISTSSERLWKGAVATGGGAVVQSYEWHGRPPAKLAWDGRGANGKVEPDGVYQFSIHSTDEAGNYAQSNVVSFVLDTQHKQLFLSADYKAFSPNGVRHLIRIIPQVRSPRGFESYRINIVDRSGNVVATFSGTGVPTGSFAWNGVGLGEQPVPQGEYRAVMTARYATGVSASAQTPWFSVITTLPTVEVSPDYHVFSPNGDGHRDAVTFHQSATGGESWTGRIISQDGKTALEKQWQGTLPASFTWNGRDTLGNVAANGTYSYLLTARDPAGNVARAEATGIVLDNLPTQVYIDAAAPGFSPNGDGIKDTIELSAVEKPATGISSWRVTILSSTQAILKEWTGSDGPPPGSIIWNGTTPSGAIAPDGSYRAEFEVHYRKGDVDHGMTEPFLLVAHPPRLTVNLSPLPLTPPSVAGARPLDIRIEVKTLDPIASWKLQIYTPPVEEPFFAFAGTGRPPAHLTWDARSADGRAVIPSSVYSYHLTVEDSLGNQALTTGNIPIGAAPASATGQASGS